MPDPKCASSAVGFTWREGVGRAPSFLARVGEGPGGMTPKRWVFENLFAALRRAASPRDRKAYFAGGSDYKINIGAGRNVLPGWLNVDAKPRPGGVWLDASRPWPFLSETFSAALCEHMIEHVPKPLAQFILDETLRTLKPGGWFRVITPDLTLFASHILGVGDPADRDYLDFLATFNKVDEVNWCDAINIIFREYSHEYIWTVDELSGAMIRAGFIDLKVDRATRWTQPVFKDTEGHPKVFEREAGVDGVRMDALEAFAIEGMKPL